MKQINMNYKLTQYCVIPTSKPPGNKWEFSLQKGIQAISRSHILLKKNSKTSKRANTTTNLTMTLFRYNKQIYM